MLEINVICKYCRHSEKDVSLEINFPDNKIYYVCPKCRKENIINFGIKKEPYPTGTTL